MDLLSNDDVTQGTGTTTKPSAFKVVRRIVFGQREEWRYQSIGDIRGMFSSFDAYTGHFYKCPLTLNSDLTLTLILTLAFILTSTHNPTHTNARLILNEWLRLLIRTLTLPVSPHRGTSPSIILYLRFRPVYSG